MTREERIQLAIEKGITYDEVTGKIYGKRGNEIINKKDGYIRLSIRNGKKQYNIYAHHIAFYIKYNKIVEQIDHIDGDRSNNKIDNLREVTNQQNLFNIKNAKGYTYEKSTGKYKGQLSFSANGIRKSIYLGRFDTEVEARQAYFNAKKIYHII